jgi:DNA-binding CsgD family transcriptional regulator/catechol 2,3-dioxygenase-like lactoylglutathione lyase family enzyme
LTPAEWRVVHAIRHGMTNREIARRLGISLDAVKAHAVNARTKLGLEGRAAVRHWHGAPRDSALVQQGPTMAETTEPTTLGPIGQISRRVRDIDRAVVWYRDVLGLRHLFTAGALAFFDCQGIRLFLSAEPEGAADEGDSILYFRTADIEAAHRRLAERGVTFRGAPHLIHRHESGLEEWMVFFEDVDGKLLALMSQVSR